MTPAWYSTVFGLLYFSGGFVAALSLVAVIARDARRDPSVAASIHASHTGALGRLMFAFLVFWAYMEFSQGLIIWIANKPDEVPWYVLRGAGAWGAVFATLLIGHFFAPFFVTLSKPFKRKPTPLALVGWWILLMHYVDIYWIVMPILHHAFQFHWLDVAAPLAVVGFATAFAHRNRARAGRSPPKIRGSPPRCATRAHEHADGAQETRIPTRYRSAISLVGARTRGESRSRSSTSRGCLWCRPPAASIRPIAADRSSSTGCTIVRPAATRHAPRVPRASSATNGSIAAPGSPGSRSTARSTRSSQIRR